MIRVYFSSATFAAKIVLLFLVQSRHPDPFAIAGIHLGKTTQSDLTLIWHIDPQLEVGEHPHSARRWRYRNALIDTDGRHYLKHAVIIDTVQFSSWNGDLSRFLTGSAYPEWMKGLHVGDAMPFVTGKVPKSARTWDGQTITVELSRTFTVICRFSTLGLASLTCSSLEPNPRIQSSS